jgi:hypothetical protein
MRTHTVLQLGKLVHNILEVVLLHFGNLNPNFILETNDNFILKGTLNKLEDLAVIQQMGAYRCSVRALFNSVFGSGSRSESPKLFARSYSESN